MIEVERHRALVHDRWPELRLETFEPFGDGWDCFTYVVDGEWIFQFPRWEGAAAALRRQIELLPGLAQEVSAKVPTPIFVSEEEPPCMGYPLIHGSPMDPSTSGFWPERLGRFLYDLHLVPPEFVGMRPSSAAAVRAGYRTQVDELGRHVLPLLSASERAYAEGVIESFFGDDANFRFATCLTHGDIGPAHVLLTEGGDLSGVIDWGDASVGDPAADLAWILHAAPAVGERVLAAYGGPPDDRFVARTRFRFTIMPWFEAHYGVETGQPAFVESGLAGVRERLG